jgi:hypothetical protein
VFGSATYESSNTNLSARVAELRERSMEQTILLPKRLDIGICSFSHLELHISVGDFWDWRAGGTCQQCRLRTGQSVHLQVEHDGKQEYEACNSQIDPLHVLQRLLIVADVIEDSITSNDGCYNSTDTSIMLVTIERNDRYCNTALTH